MFKKIYNFVQLTIYYKLLENDILLFIKLNILFYNVYQVHQSMLLFHTLFYKEKLLHL